MRNFKDLKVWDKSHHLTLAVYQVTATFPKEELYGLTSQIRRASVSISANIAEYPVMALTEGKQGCYAARNQGILYAKGDLLASTDADCLVNVNWAKEMNRTFQDPQVDAVMGFSGGINTNFWAHLEQKNFEEYWYRKHSTGYALRSYSDPAKLRNLGPP